MPTQLAISWIAMSGDAKHSGFGNKSFDVNLKALERHLQSYHSNMLLHF